EPGRTRLQVALERATAVRALGIVVGFFHGLFPPSLRSFRDLGSRATRHRNQIRDKGADSCRAHALVEQLSGERFASRVKRRERRAAVWSKLAHRVRYNARAPNLLQRVAVVRQ